MFEQILQLVKEGLDNHPAVTENMTKEEADAMHHEIATHITNGIQTPPEAPVADGGILSQLENSLGSGNILTSAISGGLVGSLASKFGLSPAITGAIAAAIPGLVHKYMNKTNEPAVPVTPATA